MWLPTNTGAWFQPLWKILYSQLGWLFPIFPNTWEKKEYPKPPTSILQHLFNSQKVRCERIPSDLAGLSCFHMHKLLQSLLCIFFWTVQAIPDAPALKKNGWTDWWMRLIWWLWWCDWHDPVDMIVVKPTHDHSFVTRKFANYTSVEVRWSHIYIYKSIIIKYNQYTSMIYIYIYIYVHLVIW